MEKTIGFIGLGIMGFPMAGHLATKGYKVSVFNRTLKKSQEWIKKYNGTVCESLSKLAESSEVIFLCVGNDVDVKNIINGGRYDQLISDLGSKTQVSAVGAALNLNY